MFGFGCGHQNTEPGRRLFAVYGDVLWVANPERRKVSGSR